MITGASVGMDGGGVAGPASEGTGTFVVQKFVKSKGPHAFIIRQVPHPRKDDSLRQSFDTEYTYKNGLCHSTLGSRKGAMTILGYNESEKTKNITAYLSLHQ